jgi:predicted dehydrogenase
MALSEIRVGFIGTGGNGRGHIAANTKIPGVTIAAFADPSAESLSLALERAGFPVPTFSSAEEMIAQVPLDAVVISTPHTLHFQQVMYALDHGLHVLVEKPMVCSSADARAVIAKQKETGKVVCLGYQRHFEPRFRWVREQIASGRIGRVTFIQCFQSQNWLRNQQGKWRLEPEMSGGGQLNDSGSHLVDIILWVTGLEAEEVTAYVDNRRSRVDVNSAISVRFTNGAIGNISVVGDQVANRMWEDVTIAGDRGIMWLRQGGNLFIATEGALEPTRVTDFGPAVGNKNENFIQAIRGAAQVQVPPVCGLRVIELTEAVWRAAEQRRPVQVEKSDMVN